MVPLTFRKRFLLFDKQHGFEWGSKEIYLSFTLKLRWEVCGKRFVARPLKENQKNLENFTLSTQIHNQIDSNRQFFAFVSDWNWISISRANMCIYEISKTCETNTFHFQIASSFKKFTFFSLFYICGINNPELQRVLVFVVASHSIDNNQTLRMRIFGRDNDMFV